MNPSNYPNDFNKMVNKPYSYHDHIINKPEKATIQKRRRNMLLLMIVVLEIKLNILIHLIILLI